MSGHSKWNNIKRKKEKKDEAQKIKVYLPAKDIPRSFVDIYRDIENRKYYEYWLEGGRGSDKSSIWSEIVAELLENNPNMCALLIRKVGNTLKDSVYSQIQWGIDKLGETYPNVPFKSFAVLLSPTNGKVISSTALQP